MRTNLLSQEDYFGDIDGCPSKTVNPPDSDFDNIADDVDQVRSIPCNNFKLYRL